jgi:hypothetical protein
VISNVFAICREKPTIARSRAPNVAPRLMPAVAPGLRLGTLGEPGDAFGDGKVLDVSVGVKLIWSRDASADAYGGSNRATPSICQYISRGSAIFTPDVTVVVVKGVSSALRVGWKCRFSCHHFCWS